MNPAKVNTDISVIKAGANGKTEFSFRWAGLLPWVQMLMLAMYLFFGHFVMAYSDPHHWIYRAIRLVNGAPVNRRVLLFPLYLALMLKWVGPAWVFLANIPWLMLLAWQTGRLAQRFLPKNSTRIHRALLGVLGVACLLLFMHNTLLRCINPYREAGAFSLLLGGWLLFLRSEERFSWKWGWPAGALLTASMGFRETTALCIIPIVIWVCVRFFRRPARRIAWSASLFAGALLGLFPFLFQNYMYSGNALVPAYSAHLIVERDSDAALLNKGQIETRLEGSRPTKLNFNLDKLVPGMSPADFPRNAPKVWKRSVAILGRGGLILALLGLVMAIFRRQKAILGLLLPSLVVNYLFYSCYFYVKWRYLFPVDLLLSMLVAYGAYEAFHGLEALIRYIRSTWVERVTVTMVLCVVMGTGLWIAIALHRQPSRLKVWEMAPFREQVQPLLREPWSFVGFRHEREMLSWVLGADFHHTSFGSHIDNNEIRAKGLDAVLHEKSATILAEVEARNLYLHDSVWMPTLSRLWCELEPVVDLALVRPSLDRYGGPLAGSLYRICRWRNKSTQIDLAVPKPGSPTVLFFNPRRPWDYVERTTLSLWAKGREWQPRVENGTQVWELPEHLTVGECLALELRSDAPTPSSVGAALYSLNDEIEMACGFQRSWWFFELVSSNLRNVAPMRADCWMLWDHGSMRFPVFAETNRDVHVELALELYQEDPLVRNRPAFLESKTTAGEQRIQLPRSRKTDGITFALGAGTGHLDWRSLHITSTLHSYTQQRAMLQEHDSGRIDWRFIKLYNARIFSVPAWVKTPWKHNVGDRNSGAYTVSGIYSREKHLGSIPVRWTSGTAVLRLPRIVTGQDCGVVLRYYPRPEAAGATTPSIRWNGLQCALRAMDRESHDWVEATYTIPAGTNLQAGHSRLDIVTPEWNPHELLGVPDSRGLGIMLYQIEVREL
ncbi:MAG: hypothetical protein QGH42_11725 [Kiritimatiellia bacterium]|nr:hypothetical protein [Kiritimatiellia bacterium]